MDIYKQLNITNEEVYNLKTFSIFEKLQDVENLLDTSIPILGCFCIVSIKDLCNKVQSVYNVMPEELIKNKNYFYKQKGDNVFVQLDKINSIIEESKSFCGFIMINKYKVLDCLDVIYELLPEDLKLCREDNREL